MSILLRMLSTLRPPTGPARRGPGLPLPKERLRDGIRRTLRGELLDGQRRLLEGGRLLDLDLGRRDTDLLLGLRLLRGGERFRLRPLEALDLDRLLERDRLLDLERLSERERRRDLDLLPDFERLPECFLPLGFFFGWRFFFFLPEGELELEDELSFARRFCLSFFAEGLLEELML